MNYSIVVSDKFQRELKKLAKKYGSLKQDYANFLESLEEKPTQGVSLGKDCYKIRLAITSKGQAGRWATGPTLR
jgi:mRNA-degrading endonuclease RelE of RelBE toxin-antitoxin system